MTRLVGALILGPIIAVGLGACTGADEPDSPGTSAEAEPASASATASAPSGPAPTPSWVSAQRAYQRWLAREPLPSCGEHSVGFAGTDPVAPLRACLQQAWSSRSGAEATVEHMTVEGDPIRTYIRVTPERRVEVYEDSTEDGFGSKEWRYVECGDLREALSRGC